MRTRSQIIRNAYYTLNAVQIGQPVAPELTTYADEALVNHLLSIHKSVPLDFDPTAEVNDESIPEEHAGPITNLIRYAPELDSYDARNDPPTRAVLFRAAMVTAKASIIGPSNHLDEPPRRF